MVNSKNRQKKGPNRHRTQRGKKTPWSTLLIGVFGIGIIVAIIVTVVLTQQPGSSGGGFPAVNNDDSQRGNADSNVVLIEYLDLQCPACRSFHPVVEAVYLKYRDSVNFVTRHFPISIAHPNAIQAAIAAEAAGRQGRFFEMVDLFFINQPVWSAQNRTQLAATIENYAVNLGLDLTQFGQDLVDPEISNKITAQKDAGTNAGVNATPTFILNGVKLSPNPSDLSEFEALLDEAIINSG